MSNQKDFSQRLFNFAAVLVGSRSRILILAAPCWLAFLLLCASAAQAQIAPSDDSMVNSGSAGTNYGASATVTLVSGKATGLVRFDLSSLPAGYTSGNVAKATLKLYVGSVTTAGSFNVDYITSSWNESTVTYSTQPSLGATIAGSVPISLTQKNQYIQVDVTAAVGAWLDGTQQNYGLALVANAPLYAAFNSKESTTTSHAPELDIVFTGNGAQGPQGPEGPQGPQGPEGPQGPIGPAGPQGPTGPVGIANRGSWSPSTNYQINDVVAYDGASWIAIVANNNSSPYENNPNWQLLAGKGINNQGSWVSFIQYQVNDAVTDGGSYWLALVPNLGSEPSVNNPNWQLLASQGSQGTAGPQGPQGAQGPQGSIGPTGPQGPQGAQGAQGPIGPVGPVGPAGPQGDPGPAGPVGITNRGEWNSTTSYIANDAVSYSGQYWLATGDTNGTVPSTDNPLWQLLAASGSAGAPGPQGPPGAIGPQGPAGPQGAQGPQGDIGPQGPAGPPGTGVLNGTTEFTGSGFWIAPAGVTRVIVEMWGGGGGGGACTGGLFCASGGGGGAGAYARAVIVVSPLNFYTVTVGTGGGVDQDGSASSFSLSGTTLLQAGGGVQGGDGTFDQQSCAFQETCGHGGTPVVVSGQIGHTGASSGIVGTNCNLIPDGGAGYPIQGFPATVGAGGSGVYDSFSCTNTPPPTSGENGYVLLTW